MTLEQLRYIIEIVSTGSMNKAAISLNVTQPNLSTAIKNLEAEVGYKIFTRTKQGVILTQKGRRLLHYAENIQIQLDSMKYIDSDIDELQTTFSLTSQYMSAALLIIKNLCRQYKSRHFSFEYQQKPLFGVIEDVYTGKSDIGIISYANYRQDYIHEVLREHDLEILESFNRRANIAVTQNHPLFSEKQITLDALQLYPFVHLDIVEKTFFATELLEKVGFYKHKQRIVARDLFSLYYLCDHLDGITILTSSDNVSINNILNSYAMTFRLFPIEDFAPHVCSYIHTKGHKLRNVELDFMAEVYKTTAPQNAEP